MFTPPEFGKERGKRLWGLLFACLSVLEAGIFIGRRIR